jgi:Phi-29 DNA terminal protein GP3
MGKGGIKIMAKKRISPIRISAKDELEYKKLVANSRRKIRDVNKKYGIDLTGEVELKKLSDFTSRDEYNEWKQKQRSFTNRNNLNYQFVKNEFGVSASKATLNKIKRDIKTVQRQVDQETKRRETLPFISGGKVQGTVGQRMLQMARPMDLHRPKDFNFSTIKSIQRLRDIERNMSNKADPKKRDEKAERWKNMFIETLERTFNSDADDIIDKIRQMSGQDFYDMYQVVDEFSFDYYDPSPQEGYDGMMIDEGNKLRELRNLEAGYERYMRGEYGPSLKDY